MFVAFLYSLSILTASLSSRKSESEWTEAVERVNGAFSGGVGSELVCSVRLHRRTASS